MSLYSSVGLLCLLSVAIWFPLSEAQNSIKDFLDAHNKARAEVGVPNLVWDKEIATVAKNYVISRKSECILEHSNNNKKYGYGENIGLGTRLTGVEVVNLWVAEKEHYDYNSNRCVGGPNDFPVCGHYIQVVWRNTTHVGCAREPCDNGHTFYIACNYYPSANPHHRPY